MYDMILKGGGGGISYFYELELSSPTLTQSLFLFKERKDNKEY